MLSSISAAANGLAAFGTIALFFAIMRRAPKGIATRLLGGTLVALIYHYLFCAAAALLHSESALWTGAAQAMLFFFWVLLCVFLIAVVRPRVPNLFKDWGVLLAAAIVSIVAGIGIFLIARVSWALYTGSPLQPYLADLITNAGTRIGILWILPITTLLAAPGRLNPEVPDFLDFFVGNRWRVSLISLRIRPYPAARAENTPFSLADFRALSVTAAIGAMVFCLFAVSNPPVLLVLRLALLLGVIAVIYFHARFTFFDVILKRGILATFLALVIGLFTFLVPMPRRPVFCVGATVFATAWARLSDSSEKALDRAIFRRPDYSLETSQLSFEMANCKSASELGALVSARLKALLHTNNVEYGASPMEGAAAMIHIGSLGYLSLGDRDRGQPYRSEDLTFLDAVSAQFAAQMQTLETQQAKQLAASAEIRALRAQINPHFLFNTLNTAAEMAKASPEVERLILNLSRVFRSTLQASMHERIPLREDLASVRALLEIEAVRFENKLDFSIEAMEDALDILIPPLLIQPLVENAVRHGIAPKLAAGTIRVEAERTVTGIRVSVIDDGVGFTPGQTTTNVGLANVQSRVESEGGVFSLHSSAGVGTTVSFELNCHESSRS